MSVQFLLLPLLLLPLIPLSRLLRRMCRPPKRPPSTTRPPPTETPLSFLVVLGSGGHTTEILTMLQPTLIIFPNARVNYLTTNTDSHSIPRARSLHQLHFGDIRYDAHSVPRAREVGQSYITSVFSSLRCICAVWYVLHKINPHVVLTNGPATGAIVGAVAVARECFSLFSKVKVKLIYIESLARVNTLSLSGKLLYGIADRFIVQWPDLLIHYPGAEYYGCLC